MDSIIIRDMEVICKGKARYFWGKYLCEVQNKPPVYFKQTDNLFKTNC